MSFVKRLWKDRISQYPNRRTINDGYVTKQVTVGRDEGTVTEQGDAFNASNMNDLEDRIYAAIEQGGGGGGGGTYDYTELTNKPQVNGNELSGDKTTTDLGIYGSNTQMSAIDTTKVADRIIDLENSKVSELSTPNFTLNSATFTNENPSTRLFQINLDVSSTGLPYTKINLEFSPSGFKCAGFSNNAWSEFWNYNKIDTYNHNAALKEGDTLQIPQDILKHKLILIRIWRYGYFGSIFLDRADIVDGHASAGVYVYVYTGAKHFTISSAGVITAGTGFGTDGQWVGFVGIG